MRNAEGRQGWWRDAVIYQVYPRSFQDATAMASATCAASSRERYFSWLGRPTPSGSRRSSPRPWTDYGYDVSNYLRHRSVLRTLAEFDEMVAALHAPQDPRHPDYVRTTTSDRHPWFLEIGGAKASRGGGNPKRDWVFSGGDASPRAAGPARYNWHEHGRTAAAWELDAGAHRGQLLLLDTFPEAANAEP